MLATDMGAGEPDLVAQEVGEQKAGLYLPRVGTTVDGECQLDGVASLRTVVESILPRREPILWKSPPLVEGGGDLGASIRRLLLDTLLARYLYFE